MSSRISQASVWTPEFVSRDCALRSISSSGLSDYFWRRLRQCSCIPATASSLRRGTVHLCFSALKLDALPLELILAIPAKQNIKRGLAMDTDVMSSMQNQDREMEEKAQTLNSTESSALTLFGVRAFLC